MFWDNLLILFFSFSSSSLFNLSKSFFALFSNSFLFSIDIFINSSPLDTLSPLLKAIFIMLPVVSDLTSIFLLWVVCPCSSIDWSIWLKLNSFTSTLLPVSSTSTFSTVSLLEFVLREVSSCALTSVNWPDPIQPTTTSRIKEAIKIDFLIKISKWFILFNYLVYIRV